jgi:tetratricopeptide (TPR) repeat protein
MDSLREATAARRANEKILSMNPNAVDARLVLGLDEYIVAGLPFYMRAIGSFGGFHGDKVDGLRNVELVSRKGIRDRYDAQILLAVLYRREKCPEKAIPLLQNLAQTFPRNYLFRLEEVQMYSDAGNKNAALKVISEVEALRRSGVPGYDNLPEEKLRYIRANLLFWYGDLGPALADLKPVTQKANELDLNTAVLAWLRLGQVYDLQGNHMAAVKAYEQTERVAPKSPAAAEAKGYISSPYHRKGTNS